MDFEKTLPKGKPISLFQVDQSFLKKILARKSFVGQQQQPMRMLNTEYVVSVPFDWETQPGIPKHPQTEIIVPPMEPPVLAVQSQTLEIMPSFSPSHRTSHTTIMSCFWMKSGKNHRHGKKMAKGKGCRQGPFGHDSPESVVEFSDVNVDSTSSSDHSRSSSSSSSVSASSSNITTSPSYLC